MNTHRLLPALLALALIAPLCGCGSGIAQPAASAAAPAEVLAVTARPVETGETLRLPARAQPAEVAQLYARATGFVRTRHVDLGDTVKEGQELLLIDAPEIGEAVREAQASVVKAKADVALARQHFDRAASLVKSGAISGSLYDDRRAALDVAEAAQTAAEARLSTAREKQAYLSVRAPFAGVVTARHVERGDRVMGDAAAAQPLFEVVVLDPLRVVVDVPQRAALKIHAGVSADVRFPELADEHFAATVARSAMRISEDGGGMRVELNLPNPDQRIPAGMVGEAAFALPQTPGAVLLPISAVVQGAGGPRVAAVVDGSVHFRPVTLGRNLGQDYEVLSGVAAGDTVVASPNALLADGAAVRVRAPAAAAGAH